MTFYKNLGPITYEYETQQLEVFSGSDSTFIFQFKHYSDVDVDCLASLMTVYQFMLKDESLLQLYTEKNKPVSILLHKAVPVSFQHINIQFFCQIIKQMATSIFQTSKMAQNKIGEITQQMFFQIDGHLRYLYFPVKDCSYQEQQIVSEIVQFFNSLKEDKEVSHRLLLKKISKCASLESVIQETEYFMSIYHSKQSVIGMKQQGVMSQQTFFTKTIKNPYLNQTNPKNQNHKIKGFNTFGRSNDISSGKNTTRRKFNLFKDTQNKSFRNSNYSSQLNLSTWRKNDRQTLDQNATLRSNSKALHNDMTQRSTKKQSSSLFLRSNSTGQSQQRLSHRKLFTSTHTKNQNYVSSHNQPFVRSNSRQNSKHQQRGMLKTYAQPNRLKQSGTFQNADESLTSSKQINSSQNLKNTSSSDWMKQMVNNSLQKWRQNSTEKVNIFSRIKHQDKQNSIIAQSRSKIIQKVQKVIYQDIKDNFNEQEISCFFKKAGENLTQSTKMTTFTPIQSQSKLNKPSFNNHSTFIETPKQEFQQSNVLSKNSQEFQFQYNKNFIREQEKLPEMFVNEDLQESLQQIKLGQSSIQQITLKNKQEQLKISQKIETKKPSLKDISQKKTIQNQGLDKKEQQKSKTLKASKKNTKQQKDNDASNKKQPQKDSKFFQFSEKLKQTILEKQQIDFIGVAVVQTADHLKTFESIFWQLPMFFLYKKFYQKRLQLSKTINQLLTNINSHQSKQKIHQQILTQTCKHSQQISQQNQNIQQSLKKLLKTVKKKIKKEYPRKQEQQYVQKHLHLDFTIPYDDVADQFISMYLQSLLEAKSQFPQLVFHIIDIFQAVSVYKGQLIDTKKKESFDSNDKVPQNIQKAEKYFTTLLKKKQIKLLLRIDEKKPKGKK